MTHRDEVHGDVTYDPLAVALLNTPVLQRLGRVYQLGFGHLVFRGGTHTRLSHVMGAYHVAGRLVDALDDNYAKGDARPEGALEPDAFLPRVAQNGGARQGTLDLDLRTRADLADRWVVLRHLVSWAALLHDIGHVPMGHTLEDEFEGIYAKHDDFSSPRLRHLWLSTVSGGVPDIVSVFQRTDLYPEAFERAGLRDWESVWGAVLLICTYKETFEEDGGRTPFAELLGERIEEDEKEGLDHAVADRLLELLGRLAPSVFSPYMADIVANTISADYLDYLRRDPRNLGLDVLEDDRVVSRFWVGEDIQGQRRMALSLVDGRGKARLDTCTGVVELVRQRYRFAEIVYYHKTKVGASAMLAKVFHLIGTPREIPTVRSVPALDEAEATVDRLFKGSSAAVTARLDQLRADVIPSSLLDTEVGDEGLILFLIAQGWSRLEDAVAEGDRETALAAVQGLILLDALARRIIYKPCLTVNSDAFQHLSHFSGTPGPVVEGALQEFIRRLRKDSGARASVEEKMVGATGGWPQNSLLLYVPPRKSQAKGIETGALMDGRVVTLGLHPAVHGQVKDLNDRYQQLWRLIVLVHPDYMGDAVGLSDAVDAFAESEFAGLDLDDGSVVAVLREACWFGYIARRDRAAAALLPELLEGPAPGDWAYVDEFAAALKGHANPEEHATGAALMARLAAAEGLEAARGHVTRFSTPGSLTKQIDKILAGGLEVRSREGTDGPSPGVLARRAALDEIVRGLTE